MVNAQEWDYGEQWAYVVFTIFGSVNEMPCFRKSRVDYYREGTTRTKGVVFTISCYENEMLCLGSPEWTTTGRGLPEQRVYVVFTIFGSVNEMPCFRKSRVDYYREGTTRTKGVHCDKS